MIELVMAILVLSIGILAIVAAFGSGTLAIHRASRVATAASLADVQMERYRALRYDSIMLDSGSVSSADTIPSYANDTARIPPQFTGTCPSLPRECQASQSVTGADGGSYRVDTYITIQAATTTYRENKLVTIVVREVVTDPPKTLIRVPSTFDQATG